MFREVFTESKKPKFKEGDVINIPGVGEGTIISFGEEYGALGYVVEFSNGDWTEFLSQEEVEKGKLIDMVARRKKAKERYIKTKKMFADRQKEYELKKRKHKKLSH
jgi:hypothetical protein